ncbi:hypothetical protein LMA00_21785 [Burkholderia ambifaria]|uniref:hypothetical protein n=1 Tax=Burkholderia ambifaria TaxID=152480 RepID=UPI001E56F37F|nr:hypothetical protein [Burkholderia ambifaria]UEP52060.1 hypothetical protein LMA00_21785 [Burkholderia ambifaria]
MLKIPAIRDQQGLLFPASPIPVDAVYVFCDGHAYTVHLPSDEILGGDEPHVKPPEDMPIGSHDFDTNFDL